MSNSPQHPPQHESLEDETGIDRSLDDIMDSGTFTNDLFHSFSYLCLETDLGPMKFVVISNVGIALVETAAGSSTCLRRTNLKMLT